MFRSKVKARVDNEFLKTLDGTEYDFYDYEQSPGIVVEIGIYKASKSMYKLCNSSILDLEKAYSDIRDFTQS